VSLVRTLRKNFREIHSSLCDYFISPKHKFMLEGRRFCNIMAQDSHWLQLLDSKHKNSAKAFTSWAVAGVAASKCKGILCRRQYGMEGKCSYRLYS
jgi:hypothetical protein